MRIELVLMTYNRPFHTKMVLDGIKREGFKNFKIYMDKATSEEDEIAQEQLLRLFKTIDWADYELIRRNERLGLAKSITTAVSETLQNSDALILLEDDCVPKTNFKKFMETGLNLYKDRPDVKSICAYKYPSCNPEHIEFDAFTSNRFCPWGWATWADQWRDFEPNLKNLLDQILELQLNIAKLGDDVTNYCLDENFINQTMDIWSINWILAHLATSSKVVYPKYSLINNVGFDGSGVHSEKTSVFKNCEYLNFPNSNFSFPQTDIELKINKLTEKNIIEFLEKTSKMTMLLNKCNESKKTDYGYKTATTL